MSKNVNFIGARNLRKIRVDLGLAQRELECEHAQNLSHLENGVKAITEDKSAPALIEKIKEVMNERGLTLPYEVTIDLLLGKSNIITNDILKRLKAKKTITLKMIEEIDNCLKDLPCEEAIIFLSDVTHILNNYEPANANTLKKYSLQLLKLDVDWDIKVRGNRTLITAYSWLNKHDEIINIAETIEQNIDRCKDKEVKVSCYRNIARAYYCVGNDNRCMDYLKKLKLLGKGNEFFTLTLESAIFAKRRDFNRAERIYFKILDKAESTCNSDYIVESCSNLAGMYDEMGLKDKAREYLNRAIESIRVSTQKIFIFNTYYNGFVIYNKYFNDEVQEIEVFLQKSFSLAVELNLKHKVNKLFDIAFNMYFESNNLNKIADMLEQIDEINIKSEILLKVMKNMA